MCLGGDGLGGDGEAGGLCLILLIPTLVCFAFTGCLWLCWNV